MSAPAGKPVQREDVMGLIKSASRIAALVAAGFVMSSAQAATFLYVGSSDSQDITVLSLDPKSGALTQVAVTPVP
jgi:6-phosphogluconolactonase (cycloisomerase 2 family)